MQGAKSLDLARPPKHKNLRKKQTCSQTILVICGGIVPMTKCIVSVKYRTKYYSCAEELVL